MDPLQNAIHVLPCAILGIAVGVSSPDDPADSSSRCGCATRFQRRSYSTSPAGLQGELDDYLANDRISSLLYALIPPDTNYWASGFIAQLFVPWGPDFIICIGNVLVANMVDSENHSVGGAVFQTSYTIGGGLGTALSSLVITGRSNAGASLHESLKAAFGFTAGMAWSGELCQTIALTSVAIVVFIGLRKVDIARSS